jgi:hypothetical protein
MGNQADVCFAAVSPAITSNLQKSNLKATTARIRKLSVSHQREIFCSSVSF